VSEYGSRKTALLYAGVSVRDVGRFRDLSPERIKQQLRRLCTTGYDLGAEINQDRDRALYDAARQHFGGWRDALAAAGINLANVTHRKPNNVDREAMLLWIRNRHSAEQTLIYTEVCLENRDYALAIRSEFGSWAKAIEEATLNGNVDEG